MAVYVDYSYQKKDGSTGHGTAEFYHPNKAIRFIYSIASRKNYSYDGFSADDEWETEYILRRI